MKRSTNRGFSLVETLVALSLGAIALAYGVPSYQTFIANTRMSSATNLLLAHISAARSTAITRGLHVAVCASADQATCSGTTSWETGWIVFTDADGEPGILDGADKLLHSAQPQGGSLSFQTESTYLRYSALGSLDNS